MKKIIFILPLLLLVSSNLYSQVPSKTEKLVGTWDYKEGSGYEIWKMSGDKLLGEAYRVNKKTQDTSKVEEMSIRKPAKNLLYSTETYSVVNNQLVTREQNYIANGRKMKFFNLQNRPPYAVEYKFGWFSKKKMKVFIYHGPHDKPLKLTLYKR